VILHLEKGTGRMDKKVQYQNKQRITFFTKLYRTWFSIRQLSKLQKMSKE